MFVNDAWLNDKFRGYNPTFYKRVMAKRKAQAAERRVAQEKQAKKDAAARRDHDARELQRRCKIAARAEVVAEADLVGASSAREIITRVAHSFNVTYADVIGPHRCRHIIKARDAAIRAVSDARPEWSLPHIGRVFGGRDHTTVLHSLKKTAPPGKHWRA